MLNKELQSLQFIISILVGLAWVTSRLQRKLPVGYRTDIGELLRRGLSLFCVVQAGRQNEDLVSRNGQRCPLSRRMGKMPFQQEEEALSSFRDRENKCPTERMTRNIVASSLEVK